MNVTYYNDLEQGSKLWLEARLGIITASQVSRMVTPTGKLADNNDSRSIVYEKVAERITGRVGDLFSNHYMEMGNLYEPFARDLYSKERAQVTETGFIVRQFDGYKIGYSPDGLVGEDGLIEIKVFARQKHIKEICQNKPPAEYMMQMQTGMLVTGRKWCDYVTYNNGMKMRITRVLPDQRLHDLIVEAASILEQAINHNIELYNTNTIDMPLSPYFENAEGGDEDDQFFGNN